MRLKRLFTSPVAITGHLAFFSLAGAGLVPAVATAEDLPTLTVSASRVPLPLGRSGSAVTVFDREFIRSSGTTALADLLREVPGFAVSQQGAAGTLSQVRVRGSEANQVLVLIDGVEANDVAQGSEFNFTQLNTDNIERIEIVRGPQSALWGSDALAGVISIHTRKGQAGFAAGFDVEGGSSAARRLAGHVGNADVMLAVDYASSDGTNISRTGTEDDGHSNLGLSLSANRDLAHNLRASVSVRHTRLDTDFDDIDFVNTGLPVDAAFVTDAKTTLGGLRLAFDGEHVSQYVSLQRSLSENINHTGGTPETSRGDKLQLQYQANWSGISHSVTGVAEFERDEYAQRGPVSFFGDPNRNLDANSRSVGVEYRFAKADLDVSLSGRFDRNSEFDNSRSWRGTLSYRPAPVLGLFASVGESVKNPTFTERFGFFDTFKGNPALRPELAFTWEAGIRATPVESVTIEVTHFDADLDDEIDGFVFDGDTGAFTAANIAGRSTRQGLEARIQWVPGPSLAINGTWTFLDASQPAGLATVAEVRRPKHSGSLGARWHEGAWSVAATAVFTGEQADDFFPPVPPFQARVALDGHVTLRARVSYQVSSSLDVYVRASNLTDVAYEEVFGFVAPGRSVHTGLRVKW